jgi:hypothetical protein
LEGLASKNGEPADRQPGHGGEEPVLFRATSGSPSSCWASSPAWQARSGRSCCWKLLYQGNVLDRAEPIRNVIGALAIARLLDYK